MEKNEQAVEQLSFEQCLEQLQGVVQKLEGGSAGLSESIVEYERGVAFLKRCHELLESAEQRIQLLSGFDADGNPVVEQIEDSPKSLEEKANQRGRRRTRRTANRSADGNGTSDDMDDSATLF